MIDISRTQCDAHNESCRAFALQPPQEHTTVGQLLNRSADIIAALRAALDAPERNRLLSRLREPDEAMIRAYIRAVYGEVGKLLNEDGSLTREAPAVLRIIADELDKEWKPTHQHKKGGLYRVVCRGKLEWNLEPAVVYESRDGHVWVRPEAEFEDGRFTKLDTE